MKETGRLKRKANACLICGEELQYLEKSELMACVVCNTEHLSNAKCAVGHYVCDECHSKKGIKEIINVCHNSKSRNPIEIARSIMAYPYIYMHGPEHHILVGASLLTAYSNSGGDINLENALSEIEVRGKQVPGGFCGLHGCCGAAVSTGIYYSIITECTPLKKEEWQKSNLMTAAALTAIARHGGPRCCKRDSFLAIREAAAYTEKNSGIKMELPKRIACGFFKENNECLKEGCLFYPSNVRA